MKMKFAAAVITVSTMFAAIPAAHATLVCPFTDHFFIKAPVPLTVLNYSVDGNLGYTPMSYDYFRLSCKDVRVLTGGTATLDIGMTNQIKCTVKIQDGPYQMNPTVTEATCGGPASRLYFIGMDHPYGTSDYFLKFTT